MSMEQILREKRKALGLTQEQVANYLGVTAPAVNKWEKGTTCPDITLLSALARLLKTDPNTLLSFQEQPSREELLCFQNQIIQTIQTDGMERGFALAMEYVREFPTCAELLHTTALTLDNALILSNLSPQEKEPYERQIVALYQQTADSDDAMLANRSNYMLAVRWIAEKEYDKAQEALDALPPWNALDQRGMQADIWSGRGELTKAAKLLEEKLLTSIPDHQSTPSRLIRLAVQEGDEEEALALAECAQKECEAFHLGDYWSHIGPLTAAAARKDTAGSIAALSALLAAASNPWNSYKSPLFRHNALPELPSGLTNQILSALLSNLEQAPEYEFLRPLPEFQALIQQYRG